MQSKSVSKMLMMTAPVVAVCGFLMTASLAQAEDRPGRYLRDGYLRDGRVFAGRVFAGRTGICGTDGITPDQKS
jgi:hypothetical protein